MSFVLFFLLSFQTHAFFTDKEIFTKNECLAADFSVHVSHQAFPFGLNERRLSIHKERCVLTIEHHSFWFIDKKWEVDICRAPIHIKSGTRSVRVILKEESCQAASATGQQFCQQSADLMKLIESDGLIFADGERERLDYDHGKVYCTYLLLDRYLSAGKIYSRYSKSSEDFFPEKKSKRVEVQEQVPEKVQEVDLSTIVSTKEKLIKEPSPARRLDVFRDSARKEPSQSEATGRVRSLSF